MSTFVPTRVRCACGHVFIAPLARSVNAARSPRLREAILAGTFHQVRCPTCERSAIVERELLYIDLPRGLLVLVRPADDSGMLARAAEMTSSLLGDANQPRAHLVPDLAGLRELIVAEEASVSCAELAVHKGVMRDYHGSILADRKLFLIAMDDEGAHYAAVGADRTSGLTVPAQVLGRVLMRRQIPAFQQPGPKRILAPAAPAAPAAPGDPATPAAQALVLLARFSGLPDAKVPFDSADFRRMLKDLPRGSALDSAACGQLRALFGVARRLGHGRLQDALFQIRFNKMLATVWSVNEVDDDIETLWDLLEALPDADVEDNFALRKLDIRNGLSYYGPDDRLIVIAAEIVEDPSRFSVTVLHEVGHAVQAKGSDGIDAWLRERFGWRSFKSDGIDAWVDALGGWGAMSVADQVTAREYIRDTLGPGEAWQRAPVHALAPTHGWWAADCAPRLALERTGEEYWYMHSAEWLRHGGYAFFLNYWYAELYMVSTEAVELVEQMPDPYAAMSGHEFFAEMYALYQGDPGSAQAILPADVLAWFTARSPA